MLPCDRTVAQKFSEIAQDLIFLVQKCTIHYCFPFLVILNICWWFLAHLAFEQKYWSRAKKKKIDFRTSGHIACVTSHVSHATCHGSPVTGHLSPVIYPVSPVTWQTVQREENKILFTFLAIYEKKKTIIDETQNLDKHNFRLKPIPQRFGWNQ